MNVAVIADFIENGPISIRNYISYLVQELLRLGCNVILIHNQKSNDLIYKEAKEIILPLYSKIKFLEICKKVDLLHIPHLAGALAPSLEYLLYRKENINIVLTLHGVAPLVLPSHLYFSSKAYISRAYISYQNLKWKLFKNNVDSVITVSRSEKYNISKKLNILADNIRFIYHGVDHKNFKIFSDRYKIENELFRRYKVNGSFLLHVSAYQPKKNVEGIIKAFKILKEKTQDAKRMKLIICGRQPNQLKALARMLGLVNDVIFLGHISYKDLPKFYNLAAAFVFPSFHESFGMPILEAMACGCPIITSNIFSMPEITGNAAVLVNPYDVNEIANAMYRIVTDDKLKRKLRRKGLKRVKNFTWEKCAREHLEVYEEVLKI